MKPTQDNYPIFEANQVLSYLHLNQVFNYLDEQERLTRANLIGVGIFCGLEISYDPSETPATIHLSRGGGVPTEGYLMVEQDDLELVAYREYTLPADYARFQDASGKQFTLWELFPAGEPDTTALDEPDGFLSGKALLLYLELKQEGLRNCCANNCDDRGSAVTVTLRKLLISVSDLDSILKAANELNPGLSPAQLAQALTAKLGLADIRLPRFDVPNSGPATSQEILTSFQEVFRSAKLAGQTAAALSAAYQAFRPVLLDLYPEDPFGSSFTDKFGFLDTVPETTGQVLFLQYYHDFFDDLIKGYDEFRRKGLGLMCECCPPAGLFPRHLMLGVLNPAEVTSPGIYRQSFLASPAGSCCGAGTQELQQLFQRLVRMCGSFSNTPVASFLTPVTGHLSSAVTRPLFRSTLAQRIRITPSRLGKVALSDKAIPYYYLQDGTPPLYGIWNAQRSRENRANQNLGYHWDSYQPPAPDFVSAPLNYDLEPYDFLRIEGHLGENYLSVLNELVSRKNRYRLPIEIVALRTGAFDETMTVDLSKESCRFQDLETLYDTLRVELACFLAKEARFFYAMPYAVSTKIRQLPAAPKLRLLTLDAPGFTVMPNTLGRYFEDWLGSMPGEVIPDSELNLDFFNRLNKRISGQKNTLILLIAYISKLYDQLTPDLGQLDIVSFDKRFQDLVRLTEQIESKQELSTGKIEGNTNLLKWEELDDRLEAIIYNCRLDSFKEVQTEYLRRVKEVKQKQFLSFFLQNNPGIQHKGGVPLGGTFVVVYHDAPDPVKAASDNVVGRTVLAADLTRFSAATSNALSGALKRLQSKATLLDDPDVQTIFGELTGQIPARFIPVRGGLDQQSDQIFTDAVQGLEDGTVIADFFLPYLCCSDCQPIQYVLPVPPLGLSVKLGCTSSDGTAKATLTPQGGMAPFSYQLDKQPFRELKGDLVLAAGSHTLALRDSAGAESAPQSLDVPDTLTIGGETYLDKVPTLEYQVSFAISGGTKPYQADSGTVNDFTYTSAPVKSGADTSVTITDGAGCTATQKFTHTVCNLPSGGQSRRSAYRLWIQPPFKEELYQAYKPDPKITFQFNGDNYDLPTTIFKALPKIANSNLAVFQEVIAVTIKMLNEAIGNALSAKLGDLGKNRLVISYAPAGSDPFGILWIESFLDDKFTLGFTFMYAIKTEFVLNVSYTNETVVPGYPSGGFVSINQRSGVKNIVPAFDCSERNQCTGSPYQKLCEGMDGTLSIAVKQLSDVNFSLIGEQEAVSPPIMAWVWDVPLAQATEPFYVGNPASAQLKPGGPVIMTVITEKSCFSAIDDVIKPG